MKALHLFKVFFKNFKAQVIFCIVFLFIEFVFDLASIFSIAPVFDFLVHDNPEEMSPLTTKFILLLKSVHIAPELYTFLFIFLGFQILKNGFFIFVRYSILKIKFKVVRAMLIETFEDIFKARWLFFTGTGQGMILNTFNREMLMLGEAFFNMGLLLSGTLRLMVFISVPLYIAWHATIVSLLVGILFGLPLTKLGPTNYRLGKHSTGTANHLMTMINECLVSAKVVLGFGEQEKSIRSIDKAFENNKNAILKSQILAIATPLIYEPFGILAVFITIITAKSFDVPIAEIAVMIWAFMKAMPLIGHVVDRKNSLENLFPSYEQIIQLQEKAKCHVQETGKRLFQKFEHEIRFNNVTFAYPDNPPALMDISFRIPKGKMIGIVGESGAGKSTLVDMIMGFNSPINGSLTLDKIPLKEFDVVSYRKHIGYVPQESILFDMSIRDNLLWVHETATEHEIWEACNQANANEFIQEFPDKLDTIVGDRGIRLSGGQNQRISLARAILRRPDILIMDEATSSLDTKSERLIQQAIENIAKQTTILVIAHRLSTIIRADYIYVLKKGRIIEQGTYSELIKKEGSFRHMVQMQALYQP